MAPVGGVVDVVVAIRRQREAVESSRGENICGSRSRSGRSAGEGWVGDGFERC